MAEPTRSCPRCQRVVLEYHFGGADVCPVCVAGTSTRPDPTPGLWEPTNVAALGLFVNPVLITTFWALGRAREWLRFAAARDAAGEYSPWHAWIRSNAIWGIVLSAFWPLVTFFVLSAAFLMTTVLPETQTAPFDEHAEILALLEDARPAVRSVGLCQLGELPPRADDEAIIANALRRELPVIGIACGEIAFARAAGRPLAERYAQQPSNVRDAILSQLAQHDPSNDAPTLLLAELEASPIASEGIQSFGMADPSDAMLTALLRLAGNDSTRIAAQRPLGTMCARDPQAASHASSRAQADPTVVIPPECRVAP